MVGHLFGHCHRGIHYLEGGHILETIALRSAHLPTLLLLVGYPVFWLEMYVFKIGMGKTSPTAMFLFLISAFFYLRRDIQTVRPFLRESSISSGTKPSSPIKFLLGLSSFLALLIVLCIFYASFYPPHLMQEWDAIHYHITLPRQHLILESFKFIPWAADDLFLLPVQFALAPYWLVTTLPNKFPQFIFTIGLILVCVNLIDCLKARNPLSPLLVAFAILGSHHIGIQMGTAMIDLTICYLFLAALDSFWRGEVFWASVESAFFFWSKPAVPIQVTFIAILVFAAFTFLRKLGFQTVKWGFSQYIDSALRLKYAKIFRRTLTGFLLASILIAGPFIAKSIYYAGTPLFPFLPGAIRVNKNIDYTSKSWESLLGASESWTEALNRDRYRFGKERTLINFVEHLWLVAVPEKGVNNRFDYPIGLMYLAFAAPFLFMVFRDFRRKEFGLIPAFILVCWFLWWMSIQETRHLYIPTILIFVAVLPEIKEYSLIFFSVVLIALALNALSILRAHKKDFGLSLMEVLREKDQEIIKMNEEYQRQGRKDTVDLDFHDVAFAQFPVRVTKESLPHTLAL